MKKGVKILMIISLIILFLILLGRFVFLKSSCGRSTEAFCETDADCKIGGCSGQVCGGINESLISTCELVSCVQFLNCKCIKNKCVWGKSLI